MKIFPLAFAIGVLGFMGLTLQASPGYADVYKWVDEKGTVWLTDDPEKLPGDSRGQFEKVMTTEEVPETSPQSKAPRRLVRESEMTSSAESYMENRQRELDERKKLAKEVSILEANLAAATWALIRVPLTDRRGYWYIIDPGTGKKVRASYKDPGAIWSNATWPAVPRSARTKESEERRRIQSDIGRFRRDLNRAKEKLARPSRLP